MTPCSLKPHSWIVQPPRAPACCLHGAVPAISEISSFQRGAKAGQSSWRLAAAPSPHASGLLPELPPLQHVLSLRGHQLTGTCGHLPEEQPHLKAKWFPKWLSKGGVFARYSFPRKWTETLNTKGKNIIPNWLVFQYHFLSAVSPYLEVQQMKAKLALCFQDQPWKMALRSSCKIRLDKSNVFSYFEHIPIPLMSRQFGRVTGAISREALSLFLQEERAGLTAHSQF